MIWSLLSCTLFIGCNSSKKMHINKWFTLLEKIIIFFFFYILDFLYHFPWLFHVHVCIHFLGIPFDGYIHPPMIDVCHSCMDECFSFLHNDDIHSWMHSLHSSMTNRCQLSIHCEREPIKYEYVHIIVHFLYKIYFGIDECHPK